MTQVPAAVLAATAVLAVLQLRAARAKVVTVAMAASEATAPMVLMGVMAQRPPNCWQQQRAVPGNPVVTAALVALAVLPVGAAMVCTVPMG